MSEINVENHAERGKDVAGYRHNSTLVYHNGFLYKINSSSRCKDGKRYLACHNTDCGFRAIQTPEGYLSYSLSNDNYHIHEPNYNVCDELKLLNDIKHRVITESKAPKEIFDEEKVK